MKEIRINLICLAAGYAKRFGANKLLWELDGQPLFVYGLSAVLELKDRLKQCKIADSGGDRKIVGVPLVVTAYNDIADWCAKHDVSCVRNQPPENTGMASSIQKAIHFLETDSEEEYVFDMYFTADQPNLDVDVLCKFIVSFLELSRERSIGALEYGGVLRNPGIFSARWRNDFLRLVKDEGGKKIRQSHSGDIYRYPVWDGMMFADIDTPEDVHMPDRRNADWNV